METVDRPPLQRFVNSLPPSPPMGPATSAQASSMQHNDHTSHRDTRTGISRSAQTPPLEFIEPIGQGPRFHFTPTQRRMISSYPSTASMRDVESSLSDPLDFSSSDDESGEESTHEEVRLIDEADATFTLEELDNESDYDSDMEIMHPDHFEDAKSDRSGSRREEDIFTQKFQDLRCDLSSDEEEQWQYRKKRKRWCPSVFKRCPTRSVEGSSYSDNEPLDDVNRAAASRLHRRGIFGRWARATFGEEKGLKDANHSDEMEEPEDDLFLHPRGPPSFPSDDALARDELRFWDVNEGVMDFESDDSYSPDRCDIGQLVEGPSEGMILKQEDERILSGLISPDHRSPIDVLQKGERKPKVQSSVKETSSHRSGTVSEPRDVAMAPVAPNSGSTSRTTLPELETISSGPKTDGMADSPTISRSPESTLEITRDEYDNDRNNIRKIMAENASPLQQPLAAFPRSQMELKITDFLNSSVSKIEPLFKRLWRQTEITLEVLGVRENKISLGMQRLRWTCSCGKRLYDDFVELQPGALDNLRLKLESGNKPQQRSNDNTVSGGGYFSIRGFISRIKRLSWNRQGNNRTPPSASQLPTHNPSCGSTVPPISSSTSLDSLYLLLCINSGKFGVDLHHERIQHIKCDRALFHFLRKTYGQWRSKLLRALSLRTVSKIKLVKFATDMSAKVDIYPHSIHCDKDRCVCVPPESKVEPAPNSEYRCNPIPAPVLPPIGENYMMHLYSSPDCINQSQVWVYNQIPKRTGNLLMARPEAPAEGWGVHFEEGWHWPKIWAVIMAFFGGGSLLFGVLYAVLHKDAQSAFGIASYWITAATILVGYLATRVE